MGSKETTAARKAIPWDDYLNDEAKSRTGSSLKSISEHLNTPGVISLAAGRPSDEYFPFRSLSFQVEDVGLSDAPSDALPTLHAGKRDMRQDPTTLDIAKMFQYLPSSGIPQLLDYLTEFNRIVHKPQYEDCATTMTIGASSGLDMLLRMFARPGDYVLCDEIVFPSAMEAMQPCKLKLATVANDSGGMVPAHLDEVLRTWRPEEHDGARRPFLLYLIPCGQNPTGTTQSVQRRREIYEIAQRYDLLLIEDDPYYFLQMDPYGTPPRKQDLTPAQLLERLVPSYLSLDTDGRVFRLDTLSKILTPGSRVGWLTAPRRIIGIYRWFTDVSTQAASGISQLVVFKLLKEHWGHDGFLKWLSHLRTEFEARRDRLIGACDARLPKDLVSWVPPTAGMFLWLQVKTDKIPVADGQKKPTTRQVEEAVYQKCVENKVLMVPGCHFMPYKETAAPVKDSGVAGFRLCFASSKGEDMEEAVNRFAKSLDSVFGSPLPVPSSA